MKRKLIFASLLSLVALSALLISGCSKDDEDTSAPVVTVTGANPLTIVLNAAAPADPGATASDETDGSITTVNSTWSSTNPNVNQAGTYTITYTATDAAGNSGSATRTVVVKNDAAYLEGTYGVAETPCSSNCTWVQTVTASTTQNNVITFSKFANYANNSAIKAKVIPGTTSYIVLEPDTQVALNVGTSPNNCDHKFYADGNGAAITLVSGKYTFTVKFKDETTGGSGSGCSVLAPDPYVDTFLQQ